MPKGATSKAKITNRMAADAVCPADKDRTSLHDTACPGLELRITRAGGKSWVLRYWNGEAQKRLTLGDWPALTAEAARKLALEKSGEVAQGNDPAAEKAATRKAPTVADLCAEYFERHGMHKKTARQDSSRINGRILPAFGNRKAESLTRQDVALWLAGIGAKHPYEANRVQALVRKMFNWATEQGILPDAHPNPAKGIRQFREAPRERALLPDELKRLADEIESWPNEAHRAYIWGLLLTGCRKSELINVKWDDLLTDVRGGKVLRLTDTKNGQARNVPLPDELVNRFRALPRTEGNPYIFASPVLDDKPMEAPRRAWDRIREAAALTDVHLHDLRATVGTMLAAAGWNLPHIKKALGHKSDAAVKVYIRLADDAAREALDSHAAAIGKLTGGGKR